MLSVLAGVVTVGLTWRLAREWLPEADPWLWTAAAGAVGFLPMNFYLGGAVSNDAATCLAVTGGLLSASGSTISKSMALPMARILSL